MTRAAIRSRVLTRAIASLRLAHERMKWLAAHERADAIERERQECAKWGRDKGLVNDDAT